MHYFVDWRDRPARTRGQGLIAYALISAFVAFIVIGTLALLAPQIASVLQTITNALRICQIRAAQRRARRGAWMAPLWRSVGAPRERLLPV
jgi:Flp pilus assembly pilin Flp